MANENDIFARLDALDGCVAELLKICQPLPDRLDALGGQISGLLNICQAIALSTGAVPTVAANVRALAEVQKARFLAGPVSEIVIEQHSRLIDTFLDGIDLLR